MQASKIQDMPFGIVGTYVEKVKGKFGFDYVYNRPDKGLIKILGITAIHNFMKTVKPGQLVYVKCVGTTDWVDSQGEIKQKINVQAEIVSE